jgi:hypothetical protein
MQANVSLEKPFNLGTIQGIHAFSTCHGILTWFG